VNKLRGEGEMRVRAVYRSNYERCWRSSAGTIRRTCFDRTRPSIERSLADVADRIDGSRRSAARLNNSHVLRAPQAVSPFRS
jgi:hypothetical protein